MILILFENHAELVDKDDSGPYYTEVLIIIFYLIPYKELCSLLTVAKNTIWTSF